MTDPVDSTAVFERLGDAHATEVFHQNDRLACRLIHEHTGQEIDKTDGYLVMFERPVQAAAFALAYPRGLRDFASEADQALRARVGEVMAKQNSTEDIARAAKPIEVEGRASGSAPERPESQAQAHAIVRRARFRA